MDAQLLQRFIYVVEAGSLNKAAKQLNISQPSLSRSIQQLEEIYKVSLLSRTSRGVVPTSYGQAVFRRAKLIQSELRHLQDEIDSLHDLTIGEINIGVPVGIGFNSTVLPAATLPLVAGRSKLRINYVVGTREKILPLLRQGDLDFAVTTIANDPFSDELVQEALYAERGAIIARRNHPFAKQGHASLVELGRYPWAVLSDSPHLEQAVRQLASSRNMSLERGIIRSQSSLIIKSALLDSDLIGFFSYDAVRAEIENGLLCEIALDSARDAKQFLAARMVGLVYRRETALSTASIALMQNIRSQCSKHSYGTNLAAPAREGKRPGRLFSFAGRVAK